MKFPKKFISILLAGILLISATLPAFAGNVQPRWTNMVDMTITINKSAGTYKVEVTGVPSTSKIEVSATLYESRTSGYTRVDSFSASKNGMSIIATDTYSFNTSKLYKVVATAKVTANGITETVTLEKTA